MTQRKYTKNTKLFLIISAAIICVALIMNIFGVGLNLGIDFTGGSLLEYSVGEEFSTEEVNEILNKNGYTDAQVSKIAADDGEMTNLQIRLSLVDYTSDIKKTVESAGTSNGLKLKETISLTGTYVSDNALDTAYTGGTMFVFGGDTDGDKLKDELEEAFAAASIPVESVVCIEEDDDPDNKLVKVIIMPDDASSAVRSVLEAAMSEKYPGFTYVSIEHAGAVSSGDLVRNALLALAIALALMLVYIAIRFDLYSGIAAMFGLFHDVLMMLAFMSFFRFAYQVNSTFIAAILTIVGYSINNTIIVFDRIRENKKRFGASLSNIDIVEKSVSLSISRTVNTSLTTLFTLVTLYVLGVTSIKEFTFPLIVGMLSGVYSSTLLNGPVWAYLLKKAEDKKAAKAKA